MSKTLYDIQDMMDGAYSMLHEIKWCYGIDSRDMKGYYALLDDLSEAVNELITENEALKAKLTKERVSRKLDKISEEEQAYLDYFKEFYGKEL